MKWNFLYQITAASRTPDSSKIPGYATDIPISFWLIILLPLGFSTREGVIERLWNGEKNISRQWTPMDSN